MENIVPLRIQIISIIVSLGFLYSVSRLIIKGRLREEYAIFWIISTLTLVVFSFWRGGLDVIARLFGVYSPPNLVFISAIFAMLVYLLHLSVVVSKLQEQNKKLSQEIGLLNTLLKEKDRNPDENSEK